MTRLEEFRRLKVFYQVVLLCLTLQGALCDLLVSPVGSPLVNAESGTNVTLAVSFIGASDPVVTWSKGDLPVVTWVIGSTESPSIPEDKRGELRLESNGSLTFIRARLSDAGNYNVEMVKSGVGRSRANFTLRVFDIIQDVVLSPVPLSATEGSERFTLQYSMQQGVVVQQAWFFNDVELESNSHYSMEQQSLVIRGPTRSDTGQYAVSLSNPLSSVTARINVTVLYGPDEPRLEVRPAQPFFTSGDSLSLSCQAEGQPQPTVQWVFGGLTLPESSPGVLNLTNVQPSDGGDYMCVVVNEQTRQRRNKSMTLNVYEKPSGNPVCSVQAVGNVSLLYHCLWPGGTPQALLSFPALNDTISGAGDLSMTVNASANLDGLPVTCQANHPVQRNSCRVTASSPVEFLPSVGITVDPGDGKIVVTIRCVSAAMPEAVVSWWKGGAAITNTTTYQISTDAIQLQIRHRNVSDFLLSGFSCNVHNPLGSERREVQLRGPTISDFSLFSNPNKTIVTLTWEVPTFSVVTGFDIQMKGPDLLNTKTNGTQTQRRSNVFQTIDQKPGDARYVDVLGLDPDSTYRFRVIPKALMIEGEPTAQRRIGPGGGLSGPAIAGIAAGIPCSILFLTLLGLAIYFLYVYCNKRSSRQIRYPEMSRAVEKVITTQTDVVPHQLLAGGLKSPPDYNRLHQTPSERSAATIPSFVPPPPVRVATTV